MGLGMGKVFAEFGAVEERGVVDELITYHCVHGFGGHFVIANFHIFVSCASII